MTISPLTLTIPPTTGIIRKSWSVNLSKSAVKLADTISRDSLSIVKGLVLLIFPVIRGCLISPRNWISPLTSPVTGTGNSVARVLGKVAKSKGRIATSKL